MLIIDQLKVFTSHSSMGNRGLAKMMMIMHVAKMITFTLQNIMFHSTGPEEKLHKLEQERIESHKQVGKLHEQLMLTEADLEKTKKTLTEYARKNEELLIRITEYRIADQKMLEVHISLFVVSIYL